MNGWKEDRKGGGEEGVVQALFTDGVFSKPNKPLGGSRTRTSGADVCRSVHLWEELLRQRSSGLFATD